MGPALSVVCIPRKIPLEKTKFFLASGCQLEIASSLEMGIGVHFPLLALRPYLDLTCTVSFHADISLHEFTCALFLFCLEECFLHVIHPLWLFQSF